MTDRTTEDKMNGAPVKVTLAGDEYEIYPLPRAAAREWRKKDEAFQRRGLEAASSQATQLDKDAIDKMMELQYGDPDAIAELLLEYAPNIPRDVVWDKATDAEVFSAYMECRMLANPYRALANLEKMLMLANSMTSTSIPRA